MINNMSETMDKIKTLEKKAKCGDTEAQFELSTIYYARKNAENDLKIAHDWCTKASEIGHQNAQFNLAVRYHFGEEVEKTSIMQSSGTPKLVNKTIHMHNTNLLLCITMEKV